jgi:O-antigen/teichoic acid export membrane protein
MNRWLLNILSSYLRFVVSIGAVVFVTPLIIERIGLESYGIWALVLATVGLLGLMDFGLATSAVKFVAEKTGQSDNAGRNDALRRYRGARHAGCGYRRDRRRRAGAVRSR